MLNENIHMLRKSQGLSQEELALKLNVVRQTISKWERGLSVPDSEMLIALSEVFDTSVSTLLGETVPDANQDDLKVLSEKLEVINAQLARTRDAKRRTLHWLFIGIGAIIALVFVALIALNGSYLDWNFADPESAVAATMLHGFEWLFVRIAPFALIGAIVGVVATRARA